MRAEKVWSLWEVDALSLPELRKVLGKENLNEEHQGRMEFMTQLQEKGLFTWNLELEFEALIEAYTIVYRNKERRPYELRKYDLVWRRCLLLENARDKRASLNSYLEQITMEDIISLCLHVPNSVLVNLVLTVLAKRIVLGNIDYEEALKLLTFSQDRLSSVEKSPILRTHSNRLAVFFKHLWSADRYRVE